MNGIMPIPEAINRRWRWWKWSIPGKGIVPSAPDEGGSFAVKFIDMGPAGWMPVHDHEFDEGVRK